MPFISDSTDLLYFLDNICERFTYVARSSQSYPPDSFIRSESSHSIAGRPFSFLSNISINDTRMLDPFNSLKPTYSFGIFRFVWRFLRHCIFVDVMQLLEPDIRTYWIAPRRPTIPWNPPAHEMSGRSKLCNCNLSMPMNRSLVATINCRHWRGGRKGPPRNLKIPLIPLE